MVQIEIDGKPIKVNQGSMIIEVADKVGIPIPRFCYHEKLSIAANCRMCLVEVENAPKPLPACATPVSEGMKIRTCSKKAIDAQKAVMEFLLINHPLDCPICDQGGQCELQDVALGYGQSYSQFDEAKRSVKDKDIGPLISTEMTRCIHCTRCVRFGEEIAGQRELGATGRGEHMQIGTFIEQNVSSELSGNVVDLCPVGALTSKPFRFKARAWEMMAKSSISAHDCVGSNIFYHTMRGDIIRAVPKDNEAVNEIWLSDRDRYSYEALYQNRLTDPLVKKDGVWQTVEWQEALKLITNKFQEIIDKKGAQAIGALLSPNITLEEGYLLQKVLRDKAIANIDHRLRQLSFSHQEHQVQPSLGVKFAALEEANAIVLVGCDVRFEAPLVAHRMRKAIKQGATVSVVNPLVMEFNFKVEHHLIEPQGNLAFSLAQLLKAAYQLNSNASLTISEEVSQYLNTVTVSDEALSIAKQLLDGEKKHLILGAYALSSPQADWLCYLVRALCEVTGASFGELSQGANSAGCWIAGLLPHKGAFLQATAKGKHAIEMLKNPLAGYLLVQVDPEYDFIDPALTQKALEKAEYVVSCSTFDSPSLRKYADIILPITPHTETKGTFVNAQGDWQGFEAVAAPLANSKPLWKVLRVLGNFWHIPNMDYESLTEVMGEIKEQYAKASVVKESLLQFKPATLPHVQSEQEILRLAPVPIYAVDPLVRNAKSLQQTVLAQSDKVWMNAQTAADHDVKENDRVRIQQDGVISEPLTVQFSAGLPDKTILVHSAIQATSQLGAGYNFVKILSEKG